MLRQRESDGNVWLSKEQRKPTITTSRRRIKQRIAIDWRNYNNRSYVTLVKNQGNYGTCWSFGVVENLEGLNVRQGFHLQNISEQEFISCCPKCQGVKEEVSLEWLVNATDGKPALASGYPYQGSDTIPCLVSQAPRAEVQLHSWGRVYDDGTGDIVLETLLRYGPMGMGVDASCFHGYHSGVIRECNSSGINHAVLLVGAGTTNDGIDFFTIKNSWGPNFGEDGYVRIERGRDWWGNISVVYTE